MGEGPEAATEAELVLELGRLRISAADSPGPGGTRLLRVAVQDRSLSEGSGLPRASSSAAGLPRAEPLPADLAEQASLLEPVGGLSAVQRLERAWTAGLHAGRVLRGERARHPPTPPLRVGPKRCYVVLRSRATSEPRWAASYEKYLELLGGGFDDFSLSHGFASQVEGTAYCRGAGLPCLPVEA